jgi:hypothetical protein
MKKFLLLGAFAIFGHWTMFAQNISPQGATFIGFANTLPNFKTSSSKTQDILIEVRVTMDEAIFRRLHKAGRYTLSGSKSGKLLTVDAPRLGESITLDGQNVAEKISIVVQTPSGVNIDPSNNQLSFGGKKNFTQELKVAYFINGQAFVPSANAEKKMDALVAPTKKSKESKPSMGAPAMMAAPSGTQARSAAPQENAKMGAEPEKSKKTGMLLINGVPVDTD